VQIIVLWDVLEQEMTARVQFSKTVKTKAAVFWDVKPYIMAYEYWRFIETCLSIIRVDDGGSKYP
jgi:hypothetical protein